ncbi:MAG: GAF domain-containing protein [Acidobacteria bacterium]|nr:GAF domain-containing protein [Acidobacteriota bacterium]
MLIIVILVATLAILTIALFAAHKGREKEREIIRLGEHVLTFVRDFLSVGSEPSVVEDFILSRLEMATQADSALFIHLSAHGDVSLSGGAEAEGSRPGDFAAARALVASVAGAGEPVVTDFRSIHRVKGNSMIPFSLEDWGSDDNPFKKLASGGGFHSMMCLPAAQGRAALCFKRAGTFSLSQIMAGKTAMAIADAMSIARMRMEDKSARSAFKASALISIGQNINSHLSLDRVLSLIVSYVGPMLNADGTFLFLRNLEADLELAAGWWKEHVFSTEEFQPVAEHCYSRGAMVNFPDPAVEEAPEVPGVATPITTYDRTSDQPRALGVLICVRKSGEKRFSSEEADFLMSFADQAAIAVRNAELYESLRQANERLRDLDQLKDEFLQIVSHDIRSPLSAFIGLVDTLLSDEKTHTLDPEKREKILSLLIDRAQKVSQATQESLSVAQIESGQLLIHPQPTDVGELLTHLDVRPFNNCALELDIQPDLPTVNVDPERLRQIVNNLLDNAFKYSPGGGRVTLKARMENEAEPFLHLCVSDEGLGFDPREQRYLFKKFGRLNNDKTAPIGGTGMGLYICRRIVEAHGGRIWAVSDGEGKGARFTVVLPAPPAPDPS